ncbi:MAG: transposase [Thermoleophilia bacterium]|nr:transposase [Thermoleophilia bacterium]
MEERMVEKSVPKRQYTEEFKAEAERLALSVGQHEAARRLGVPIATLGNWTRRQRNLETDSSHSLPVVPNTLNRRFDNWLPNRAWVADLTYIATEKGWL